MTLSRPAILLVVLTAGCGPSRGVEEAAEAPRTGDERAAQDQRRQRIDAYRSAVHANPSDGEARFRFAQVLLENGDWAVAAPEAIRAADLLPDHAEAQVLAVSMLLGQQRFTEALERISRRRAVHPDDPKLHILFGNAKAGLPNSWSVIEHHDREWRSGRRPDQMPTSRRSEASDRQAEDAFQRARTLAPHIPEATLALANLAWAQGRLREGDAYLRRVADQSPHDVLVNRALGWSYSAKGQHGDAEKYLRAAASSGEPDSMLALADYYAGQERAEDALAILSRMASGQDPGEVAALRAAGLELRLGRPRDALGRTERILQRDSSQPGALLIKAQVLLLDGDVDQALTIAGSVRDRAPGSREARATFGRALLAAGRREQAFEELRAAWRLDRTDAAVALELAALAVALDRQAEALNLAQQAVRLNPGDLVASITLVRALLRSSDSRPSDLSTAERVLAPLLAQAGVSSELLVLQAAIQTARRQHEAARSTYLTALRAEPDSLDALSGLVGLELSGGQGARVRPRVAQALAAHPWHPEYLLLGARVASAVGDTPTAESALRTALTLSPGHTAATLLLADMLARQNRADEAKAVIEQALARQPTSFDLQLSLTQLLEQLGQVAEARTRYERLAAPNRQGAIASARLAALHVNQGGSLDVALNLALTAKQYRPSDPMVNDTLGWVYVRKGLPALGIPPLEDAVRAQPDRSAFRYHLGMAYQRTGRTAKARDELTRALELDSQFPGAREAAAALADLPK